MGKRINFDLSNFRAGIHTEPAATEGAPRFLQEMKNLVANPEGQLIPRRGHSIEYEEATNFVEGMTFVENTDGRGYMFILANKDLKILPVLFGEDKDLGDGTAVTLVTDLDFDGHVSATLVHQNVMALTTSGPDTGYWVHVGSGGTHEEDAAAATAYKITIPRPISTHTRAQGPLGENQPSYYIDLADVDAREYYAEGTTTGAGTSSKLFDTDKDWSNIDVRKGDVVACNGESLIVGSVTKDLKDGGWIDFGVDLSDSKVFSDDTPYQITYWAESYEEDGTTEIDVVEIPQIVEPKGKDYGTVEYVMPTDDVDHGAGKVGGVAVRGGGKIRTSGVAAGASTLAGNEFADVKAAKNWTEEQVKVGDVVRNLTDGSALTVGETPTFGPAYGHVTFAESLAGGTNDVFNDGDLYEIMFDGEKAPNRYLEVTIVVSTKTAAGSTTNIVTGVGPASVTDTQFPSYDTNEAGSEASLYDLPIDAEPTILAEHNAFVEGQQALARGSGSQPVGADNESIQQKRARAVARVPVPGPRVTTKEITEVNSGWAEVGDLISFDFSSEINDGNSVPELDRNRDWPHPETESYDGDLIPGGKTGPPPAVNPRLFRVIENTEANVQEIDGVIYSDYIPPPRVSERQTVILSSEYAGIELVETIITETIQTFALGWANGIRVNAERWNVTTTAPWQSDWVCDAWLKTPVSKAVNEPPVDKNGKRVGPETRLRLWDVLGYLPREVGEEDRTRLFLARSHGFAPLDVEGKPMTVTLFATYLSSETHPLSSFGLRHLRWSDTGKTFNVMEAVNDVPTYAEQEPGYYYYAWSFQRKKVASQDDIGSRTTIRQTHARSFEEHIVAMGTAEGLPTALVKDYLVKGEQQTNLSGIPASTVAATGANFVSTWRSNRVDPEAYRMIENPGTATSNSSYRLYDSEEGSITLEAAWVDIQIGQILRNMTDRSEGIITEVTPYSDLARYIECIDGLYGGANNTWAVGDRWEVVPSHSEMELELIDEQYVADYSLGGASAVNIASVARGTSGVPNGLVITSGNHGLRSGEAVKINGVLGMVELNFDSNSVYWINQGGYVGEESHLNAARSPWHGGRTFRVDIQGDNTFYLTENDGTTRVNTYGFPTATEGSNGTVTRVGDYKGLVDKASDRQKHSGPSNVESGKERYATDTSATPQPLSDYCETIRITAGGRLVFHDSGIPIERLSFLHPEYNNLVSSGEDEDEIGHGSSLRELFVKRSTVEYGALLKAHNDKYYKGGPRNWTTQKQFNRIPISSRQGLLPEMKHIVYYSQRLWATGHGASIRYTDVVDGDPRYGVWPVTNEMFSFRGNLEMATVLRDNVLIVGGPSCIGRITGSSDFNWDLDWLSEESGPVSSKSWTEWRGQLFFIAPTGVHAFDGTQVQSLTGALIHEFSSLPMDPTSCTIGFVPGDELAVCWAGYDAADVKSFVLDMKRGAWREVAETQAEAPGFANSFVTVFNGGEARLYYNVRSASSNVYTKFIARWRHGFESTTGSMDIAKDATDSQDGAVDIPWSIKTQELDWAAPDTIKRFDWVSLLLEQDTDNIDVGFVIDGLSIDAEAHDVKRMARRAFRVPIGRRGRRLTVSISGSGDVQIEKIGVSAWM